MRKLNLSANHHQGGKQTRRQAIWLDPNTSLCYIVAVYFNSDEIFKKKEFQTMLKVKPSIVLIFTVVSLILFSGVFYISVLGENNRAILKAQQFFEDIKGNNYSKIQLSYQDKFNKDQENLDELMKYHFALELSMLDYFNLLDIEDYIIKIDRENLWIPYLKTNDLRLSVSFLENKESSSFSDLFKKSKLMPLKNILVYSRDSGDWKLKEIEIESSPIQNTFTKLLKSIDLDKYISTSETGFDINRTQINTSQLSLFEKRVLILNLEKALEILKKPSKTM